MKEINRLNDLFVRYLIGTESDGDILENIVNAVLNDAGFEYVGNLKIINPYNLAENENLKESIPPKVMLKQKLKMLKSTC